MSDKLKATELRIGNITSAGVIDGIKFTNAWYVSIGGKLVEMEWIEPVPITEEWLIRMGFVKQTRHGEFDINFSGGAMRVRNNAVTLFIGSEDQLNNHITVRYTIRP